MFPELLDKHFLLVIFAGNQAPARTILPPIVICTCICISTARGSESWLKFVDPIRCSHNEETLEPQNVRVFALPRLRKFEAFVK